jgi:AraC-like DNA-binding protein
MPGDARVHQIAERWGYYNASHFHRRFKQRFGCSPSDVVRHEKTGEDDAALKQPGIRLLHRRLSC